MLTTTLLPPTLTLTTQKEPVGTPPRIPSFKQSPEIINVDIMTKKSDFVESLVDISASIIDSIWKCGVLTTVANSPSKLLPLRLFIQEILKRSKSSFSTLRLALLYLVRLRTQLTLNDCNSKLDSKIPDHQVIQRLMCGRRMFLAALITSSKYLQDKNYSNRAWAKISGLTIDEINENEREFLMAIDYRLFVSQRTFFNWSCCLVKKIESSERGRLDMLQVEDVAFIQSEDQFTGAINCNNSATQKKPISTTKTTNKLFSYPSPAPSSSECENCSSSSDDESFYAKSSSSSLKRKLSIAFIDDCCREPRKKIGLIGIPSPALSISSSINTL